MPCNLEAHAADIRSFGRATKNFGLESGRWARYGFAAGVVIAATGNPEVGIPLISASSLYGLAARYTTIGGLALEEFGNELLRRRR